MKMQTNTGIVQSIASPAGEQTFTGPGHRPLVTVFDTGGEGHTFYSIVRNVRIQSACQMLSEAGTAIAVIGFYRGFSDQAHFQLNFKRATNMPRVLYRQFILLILSPAL